MRDKIKILHLLGNDFFLEHIKRTFEIEGLSNFYWKVSDFKKKIESQWEADDFSLVVIHYLDSESIDVVNLWYFNSPVVWFFWGGDGFGLGKFYNCFIGRKTKILRLKIGFERNLVSGVKEIIKLVFPKCIDFNSVNKKKIKFIRTLDLIVPVMPGDYDLLKSKYNFNIPYFHLNYVNPIFDSCALPANNENNDNILVGNSSSFTNNHIEAIDWLSRNYFGNNKLIIPLSYGDPILRREIKKYAIRRLGADRTLAIDEFLPFEKYQSIISTCGIAIMNHKRQQALGNVIQALRSGLRIYFDEKSTIFKFLIDNGFVCEALQGSSNLEKLSLDESESNRRKCFEVFGPKSQHDKVKKLLNV